MPPAVLPPSSAIALSSMTPSAEATSPTAGNRNDASRADHVHPRLSSTNTDTTASDGTKAITFTRTFDREPSPVITLIEDGDTAPVSWRVKSWTMGAGADSTKFVGAVIMGQRQRALPAVIALLGTLTGYKSWEPAALTKFSAVMIATAAPAP